MFLGMAIEIKTWFNLCFFCFCVTFVFVVCAWFFGHRWTWTTHRRHRELYDQLSAHVSYEYLRVYVSLHVFETTTCREQQEVIIFTGVSGLALGVHFVRECILFALMYLCFRTIIVLYPDCTFTLKHIRAWMILERHDSEIRSFKNKELVVEQELS